MTTEALTVAQAGQDWFSAALDWRDRPDAIGGPTSALKGMLDALDVLIAVARTTEPDEAAREAIIERMAIAMWGSQEWVALAKTEWDYQMPYEQDRWRAWARAAYEASHP